MLFCCASSLCPISTSQLHSVLLATSSFLKFFPPLTAEMGCFFTSAFIFLSILHCVSPHLLLLPLKYYCPLGSILSFLCVPCPLSPLSIAKITVSVYIVNSQIAFSDLELSPRWQSRGYSLDTLDSTSLQWNPLSFPITCWVCEKTPPESLYVQS